MRKLYIAVLSIVLVLAYFGSTPGAFSKYHIQEENQNAFDISFPIMTSVQMKSIQAFIDVLNDAASMKAFQDVMNGKDSGLLSRNYLGSADLVDDTLNELASTGGFYIIKYDMDETAGDRKSFTMFSTPDEVTVTSGMVPNVFKTTFVLNPETGKYEEVQTVEGEALASGYSNNLKTNSYNTDYWAAKLELGKSFDVDLNLSKDGDPATNYNQQYQTSRKNFIGIDNDPFDNAFDGCTFIVFTPELTGDYTIHVTNNGAGVPFRIRYRTSELDKYIDQNYSDLRTVVDGVYTYTLTAGTKYYFAIQMPSDANTVNPYPVTISITQN